MDNQVKPNFGFTEKYLNENQILVTNNLGRTVEHLELVLLDGYFGEVREMSDIKDSVPGIINIDHLRTVITKQIEVTDTFTVKEVLYFLPGGSGAAGKLRATNEPGSIPVGIITEEEGAGGAQTAVGYRPFIQTKNLGGALKVVEIDIDADATTPVVAKLPVGAKIVDAKVLCTSSNGSGSLQVRTNAGSPVAITDAIDCITDGVLAGAGTIDDAERVVTSDGVQVVANGAGDRGIAQIYYI